MAKKPYAALAVFTFEERAVRTVKRSDSTWFVGRDVCDCLELGNHRDALSRLDRDERDDVGINDAIGREQSTIIISEAAVYRLIFTSRVAAAERFKRWLAHDVLPTIRRTGAYVARHDAELRPGGREFAEAVAAVREARLVFGLQAARAVWLSLGLPDLPKEAGTLASPVDPFQVRVQTFLAARTIADGPGARLGATDLWRAFVSWCAHRSDDARSQASFGRMLRLLGLRKRQIGGRIFYDGLILTNLNS